MLSVDEAIIVRKYEVKNQSSYASYSNNLFSVNREIGKGSKCPTFSFRSASNSLSEMKFSLKIKGKKRTKLTRPVAALNQLQQIFSLEKGSGVILQHIDVSVLPLSI